MNDLDALYEMAEQITACNGRADAIRLIRFSWCGRLRRSIGNCRFVESEGVYEIHLSKRLMGLASWEECVETVAHEVCHVLAELCDPDGKPHGKGWKECMRRVGYYDAKSYYAGPA